MKTLLILNDAPYGSERTYDAARLAGSLAIVQGAHRSGMDELTQWTAWADKVLVF